MVSAPAWMAAARSFCMSPSDACKSAWMVLMLWSKSAASFVADTPNAMAAKPIPAMRFVAIRLLLPGFSNAVESFSACVLAAAILVE